MEFLKVVSVEQVKQKIADHFGNCQPGEESVILADGLDRILARPVVAAADIPPFPRSTVDGYAVQSKDTTGASDTVPTFLQLKGEVRIGEYTTLQTNPGEAITVPTGGMVPSGADSVVMLEYVEKLDAAHIAVHKAAAVKENIIGVGDDMRHGEHVLDRGRRLTPQDIGVLAALGIQHVQVWQKPRFALVSTGDEIIDVGEPMTPGKVRDINSYTLAALIQKAGGTVVRRVLVKDERAALQRETEIALQCADIVLISGGSSVGERDYTPQVLTSFPGQGVLVHGVAIKPGKPTLLAEAMGKPVFGLPGHPVSAIIIFKVLVEYLLGLWSGTTRQAPSVSARLAHNVHGAPGMETYQMVTLEKKDGQWLATPKFGKSGMITLLARASGYIVIAPDSEGVEAGEQVQVCWL